jgi:hypothetical protein
MLFPDADAPPGHISAHSLQGDGGVLIVKAAPFFVLTKAYLLTAGLTGELVSAIKPLVISATARFPMRMGPRLSGRARHAGLPHLLPRRDCSYLSVLYPTLLDMARLGQV